MPDYHTDNAVFLVYKDWETLFDTLDSNEEAGELIKALFAFAKRGEIAEFSGALKMAFIFMSQQLDRDGHKWEETCLSRSEAGKKGGRPSKAKESKKTNRFSGNQMKAKEADTDTVTDTDTDTDTDTVTEKETDKEYLAANPIRHRHGEYNHVLLSDSEYQKLKDDFGEDVTSEYIRKVDEYCEQSGKTYKNYYLVIRNTFMKRDGIKETKKKEEEQHDWLKREDLPNGNWILYYDDREEEFDFCGNLLARRFKKR